MCIWHGAYIEVRGLVSMTWNMQRTCMCITWLKQWTCVSMTWLIQRTYECMTWCIHGVREWLFKHWFWLMQRLSWCFCHCTVSCSPAGPQLLVDSPTSTTVSLCKSGMVEANYICLFEWLLGTYLCVWLRASSEGNRVHFLWKHGI